MASFFVLLAAAVLSVLALVPYLTVVIGPDGDAEDRAKAIFEEAGAENISTSSMSKAPAEALA